jgi:hypothetical protein
MAGSGNLENVSAWKALKFFHYFLKWMQIATLFYKASQLAPCAINFLTNEMSK